MLAWVAVEPVLHSSHQTGKGLRVHSSCSQKQSVGHGVKFRLKSQIDS